MFDIFENNTIMTNTTTNDIYVVSIGGSLLFTNDMPDAEKIKAIAEVISQLHYSGKKFVIVVGGGKSARLYLDSAKSLGLNNFEQDLLGILITKANATLMAAALPNAWKKVLDDVREAKEIIDEGKIPVFGGLMPLFTTDTVAALIAEYLNGTFVNLTNVDGIFDSNPKENPEAKMLTEISYDKLITIIAKESSKPGQNVVLDLPCCMILKRSKIPAVVLNGNNLPNFAAFVRGEQFTGTTIKEIPEETIEYEEEQKETEKKKKTRKTKTKQTKRKDDYKLPDPYQIDF
ncbi:MAG: UMP kinase [Candidatus Diapherotrites archaeon]